MPAKRLGLVLEDESQAFDRQLWQFLDEDGKDGPRQITADSFRPVVDVFDRHWLQHHA